MLAQIPPLAPVGLAIYEALVAVCVQPQASPHKVDRRKVDL